MPYPHGGRYKAGYTKVRTVEGRYGKYILIDDLIRTLQRDALNSPNKEQSDCLLEVVDRLDEML